MTEEAIEAEPVQDTPAPLYTLTYMWTRVGNNAPLSVVCTTTRSPREVADELIQAQAERRMLELRASNSWVILAAVDVISLEIKPANFGARMP